MAIYDGTEGGLIDLQQAAAWTANYRNSAVADESNIVAKAHFYGKEILQKLLEQDGCMGIRMYYALDDKGQKQLILVGADAEGNNLEGMIVDHSSICPPNCSTGELNG